MTYLVWCKGIHVLNHSALHTDSPEMETKQNTDWPEDRKIFLSHSHKESPRKSMKEETVIRKFQWNFSS